MATASTQPAADNGSSEAASGDLLLPLLIPSVLVACISGYFFWRKHHEKQKEQLAEHEAEALRLQPKVFSREG